MDPDRTSCIHRPALPDKLCQHHGFTLGDTWTKLRRQDAGLVAKAAIHTLELPVPTVWSSLRSGERRGILLDRVSGISFAERMRDDPASVPRDLKSPARLHLRLHAHAVPRFGSLEARLAHDIASTQLLDEPCRRRLLRRLAAMPDGAACATAISTP